MPDIKYTIDPRHYSIIGRYNHTNDTLQFNWPSTAFIFTFTGSAAAIELSGFEFEELYYDVYINHEFSTVIKQTPSQSKYQLCKDLPMGQHTVSIRRRTEAFAGISEVKAIYLQEDGILKSPWTQKNKHIIFIGDSITCGYGVETNNPETAFQLSTENSNKSFAAVAANKLNAEYTIIAESGRGLTRNYDKTTNRTLPKLYPIAVPANTDSGIASEWDFSKDSPDVICINIGTNDFAVDPPLKENFVQTYIDFVIALNQYHKKSSPKMVLVCGPLIINYWPENPATGKPFRSLDIYKEYLNKIRKVLQNEHNINISICELSSVDRQKGYGADFHPNQWQHKKNGEELAAHIQSIMNW